MSANGTFRTEPRRVVHETIEGETIIVDLETGVYYSLTGSGPDIWRLLLAGWSGAEVAAVLEPAAVHALIGELCAAGLLEPEPGRCRETDDAAIGPWAPPVLATYTDMEYFLLLDPVHDVEEAGWPHASVAVQHGSSTRDS